MKNRLFTVILIVLNTVAFAQTKIRVFDQVLYYDGYDPVVYDSALNDGVIRHTNYLYATKLTSEQLASMSEEITMQVTIKAACDNYDRIGNINMAFVNKGDTAYNMDSVERIEIGRFITPFMDKNKQPDTVVYTYNVNYLSHIFKDENILDKYDIWAELELFGVPYAANTEIAGCAGQSHVFYGTLDFLCSTPSTSLEDDNKLIPLFYKNNLNNYQDDATNLIGTTELSRDFWLEESLSDVRIVVITSNHGSNYGGEEYERRDHFVYIDNNLELEYKPGRTSCEPFREYNTQANGIYGTSKRTDAEWQSFSNWCPGDVIDNRIIEIDTLEPGNHTFRINIPDAKFVGKQGNIPLSVYVLGKKVNSPTVGVIDKNHSGIVYPNPVSNQLMINCTKEINTVKIYAITGALVKQSSSSIIQISELPTGLYTTKILFTDGTVSNYKIIKN